MNLRTITRIYNLAMNGELDGLGAPLLTLLETLAEYPHTDLESGDDLRRVMRAHSRIVLCLGRAIDLLAKLPLWQGRDRDADAADLAEDCRAGAEAWFADLERLLERHEEFAPPLLVAARDDAEAAIAAMAADLAAGPPTNAAVTAADGAKQPAGPEPCAACGQPSSLQLAGFPVCEQCAASAVKHADELLGGAGR